jgi:hypothetical protein
MQLFALRLFIFTVLPLVVAGTLMVLDRRISTRDRRLEIVLIYLFALGVGGGGIAGAIGHLFLSDMVAESIGWPPGSPFQLEMGFANLALGVLGIIATGRRDGFREATVVAVTILGVGATIVHAWDIALTGNLAPGNTVVNVGNLLKPMLLILFLVASRRAERAPDSDAGTPGFEAWRIPHAMAAGMFTGVVATGYGVGFAFEHPLAGTLLGIAGGAVIVAVVLLRSRPISP